MPQFSNVIIFQHYDPYKLVTGQPGQGKTLHALSTEVSIFEPLWVSTAQYEAAVEVTQGEIIMVAQPERHYMKKAIFGCDRQIANTQNLMRNKLKELDVPFQS